MAGWMYRANPAHPNGVESRAFAGEPVPEGDGWVDTPAKCGFVRYPHHTPGAHPKTEPIVTAAERAALTGRVGDGDEPMKVVDHGPAPLVVNVEAPRPVAAPTQSRKAKK